VAHIARILIATLRCPSVTSGPPVGLCKSSMLPEFQFPTL
jgi:hypothetical protein